MFKPYFSQILSLDNFLNISYNTPNRVEYFYKEVFILTKNYLFKKYEKAIKEEQLQIPISTEELYGIMLQLSEIAYSVLVPRSYNFRYNITRPGATFESIASHSFFMENALDRKLNFLYGPNFKHTADGFTYREIIETARRHDLPEIITTDIPDNGDRDDEGLARQENLYWRNFSKESPSRDVDSERKIKTLLEDSCSKFSTITGRDIHAADKFSAVFMNLCLEEKGYHPVMDIKDPAASKEERNQMKHCTRHHLRHNSTLCYASEMWTMSFFDRGIHKLDNQNYFTALLIMKTIAVTGKWYSWRKKSK